MISASEIVKSLDVTGIAAIPNQVHHQVRATKHHINIALVGDAGLGKTRFINACLHREVFCLDGQLTQLAQPELRVRRAELVEAGFKVKLGMIDVPVTGTTWDKATSFKTILEYCQSQLEAYHIEASEPNRPLKLVDPRINVALFFINGLTSQSLSNLELEMIKQMVKVTKVILVIGKSDSLLPHELARLKAKVMEQVREANVQLYTDEVFSVTTRSNHETELRFDKLFLKSILPDILRS